MPYIRIKAYPKDEETKKRVVDKINAVFLEEWGCPQEAISVSIEEIAPQDWEEKVHKPETFWFRSIAFICLNICSLN